MNDSDEDVQSAVRERALWTMKQLDEDEKVEKLNQQQHQRSIEILSESGQWLVRRRANLVREIRKL